MGQTIDPIAAKYGGVPVTPDDTDLDPIAKKYGGVKVAAVETEPTPSAGQTPSQHPYARLGYGVIEGFTEAAQPFLHPIDTAKGLYQAATHPVDTITAIPGAVSAEYERIKTEDPLRTIGRLGGTMVIPGMGEAVGVGTRALARPIMRGAIPAAIQRKFPAVDLAKIALRERAVPGKAGSTARIAALTDEAGAALEPIAEQLDRAGAPRIAARDVLGGARTLSQKARNAGAYARLDQIREGIKQTVDEYRQRGGLTRSGALDRKQILQESGEGGAALRAPSVSQISLDPKLADAERRALVEILRQSPEMASALTRSQQMIGLNRVMQQQAHSTMLNRLPRGVSAALAAPMGIGLTANAVDLLGQYAPWLTRASVLAALEDDLRPVASHPPE